MLAEGSYSPRTIEAYRHDLRTFVAWADVQGIRIENTTSEQLFDYVSSRLAEGLMHSTSARQVSTFRKFFAYLTDRKICAKNPTERITTPRLPRKPPKVLTEKEIKALINASDSGTALGRRNRIMMELMYGAGLRVAELINLKVVQIDLRRGQMIVIAPDGRRRAACVEASLLVKLARYVNHDRPRLLGKRESDFLFPTHVTGHITRQAFWHIVKVCAREAGLRTSPSPQTLRNAFTAQSANRTAAKTKLRSFPIRPRAMTGDRGVILT